VQCIDIEVELCNSDRVCSGKAAYSVASAARFLDAKKGPMNWVLPSEVGGAKKTRCRFTLLRGIATADH